MKRSKGKSREYWGRTRLKSSLVLLLMSSVAPNCPDIDKIQLNSIGDCAFPPGVSLSEATLTVSVAGTATYTIVLEEAPTADVTITPSSSDTNVATVSGSVTFTAENWETAQTMTMTGIAAGATTIEHSAEGGGYDTLEINGVAVAVTASSPASAAFPPPTASRALDFEGECPTSTDNADDTIIPFDDNSAGNTAVACEDVPASATTAGMASGKVLEIFEPAAPTWAGITINLSDTLDLTDACGFTADVHTPDAASGEEIYFALEDSTSEIVNSSFSNRADLRGVSTTAAGATGFERLTFDFSGLVSDAQKTQFDQITLRLQAAADSTYYIDNIQLDDSIGDCAASSHVTLPLNFETGCPLRTDDGVTSECVDNETDSGNGSDKVLEITDSSSNPWANIQFDFATPIDFSSGCDISMQVREEAAGMSYLMKLEAAGSDPPIAPSEITLPSDSPFGGYDTLTFNFSDQIDPTYQAMNFNKLVIFVDPGNARGTTVQIDNIEISGSDNCTGNAPLLEFHATNGLDFEANSGDSCPATVGLPINENAAPVSGFGSAVASCIANPTLSGNGTAGVLRVVEIATSETWAGAEIRLSDDLDLSTNCGFEMYFNGYDANSFSDWSLPILFKLEDTATGGAAGVEIETDPGDKNSGKISFDFSGEIPAADAEKYDRIILFIDQGTTNDVTYYFDNIKIDTNVGACGG